MENNIVKATKKMVAFLYKINKNIKKLLKNIDYIYIYNGFINIARFYALCGECAEHKRDLWRETMKRKFFRISKKLLAVTLTAAMAMPVVVANPGTAEAGAVANSMPTPVVELDFEDGTMGDTTYSEAGLTFTKGNTPTITTVDGGKVLALSEEITNAPGVSTGADYLRTTAGVESLDFSNGLTVSVDIKPNKQKNDWTYFFGYGYQGTATGDYTYRYVDATTGFIVRQGQPDSNVYPGGNWDAGNTVNSDFNYFVNNVDGTEWYNLTYIVGNSYTATYVNGVLATYATVDETARTEILTAIKGGQLTIGKGIDPGLEGYIGYMDNFTLYNTELTAAQVLYVATGVEAGAITGISASNVTMNVGETKDIVATYAPSDTADFGFTLSSNNTKVANILGTSIVGVSEGTATITITSTVDTSVKSTFTVTVNAEEFGENTKTAITNPAYYTEKAGYEAMKGDFDITYTFKYTATGAFGWTGFGIEIKDENGKINKYRNDVYSDLSEITPKPDTWWGTENYKQSDYNWDNWYNAENPTKQYALEEDIDVVANIKRIGNDLEVRYDLTFGDGVTYYGRLVSTATTDITDTLYTTLYVDQATISDIKVTSLVNTMGAQYKGSDLAFATTVDKAFFEDDAVTITEMGVLLKNSANATALDMVVGNASTSGAIRKVTTSYVTDLSNLDSTQTDTSVYAFRTVIKGISNTAKEYTAVPYIIYEKDSVTYTVYGQAVTRSIDDLTA